MIHVPTCPSTTSLPVFLPLQLIAVSVDSQFSHLAWVNTPRNKGGLGHMEIPMVADVNKQISTDYGVLIEGAGIALRYGMGGGAGGGWCRSHTSKQYMLEKGKAVKLQKRPLG